MRASRATLGIALNGARLRIAMRTAALTTAANNARHGSRAEKTTAVPHVRRTGPVMAIRTVIAALASHATSAVNAVRVHMFDGRRQLEVDGATENSAIAASSSGRYPGNK